MKWISKIYSNVLWGTVCLLIILLGVLRVPGYIPYAITSGSMEPAYPVGCVVYVKAISPENLSAGDDISFYIKEKVVVTHRIRAIDHEHRQIYTYGINNKDADGNQINDAASVGFDKLVGCVEFSVPALGFLNIMMRTWTGKSILVGMVVVLFAISQLLNDLYREKEENDERR